MRQALAWEGVSGTALMLTGAYMASCRRLRPPVPESDKVVERVGGIALILGGVWFLYMASHGNVIERH